MALIGFVVTDILVAAWTSLREFRIKGRRQAMPLRPLYAGCS